MKKLLIATAAIVAFSAPAFAQSMMEPGSRSLTDVVDYSAIKAASDGSSLALNIRAAEERYDLYNK